MATGMSSTSRDAMAAVRSEVGALTSAEVGSELFSVVTLLDGERVLRRTLTDASTEPGSRTSLVRGLLGSRVSHPTLDVLASAIAQPWSRASDLLESLELLGRESLLGSAQVDGELDTVEDELFRLGRIVAASPGLERALADRTAVPGARSTLVHELLEGKATAVTQTLVTQVIERLRAEPADALDELSSLAARQREQSVAHVRSSIQLSEAQLQRLTAVLSRTYARDVTVHVEVDRDLVGGLVVQVGDEVIDGSIAGRLDDLRRRLSR